MTRIEPLRRAAERLADNPAFLAGVLLPSARAEGWDDATLAARLGCRPDQLARVLLCRRPRPEPGGFRSDVERIAAAFELNAARLAELVRLADALVALQTDEVRADGWLAAARDREPGPAAPDEP